MSKSHFNWTGVITFSDNTACYQRNCQSSLYFLWHDYAGETADISDRIGQFITASGRHWDFVSQHKHMQNLIWFTNRFIELGNINYLQNTRTPTASCTAPTFSDKERLCWWDIWCLNGIHCYMDPTNTDGPGLSLRDTQAVKNRIDGHHSRPPSMSRQTDVLHIAWFLRYLCAARFPREL